MGTTLTGTTPQDTYDSLIKVTDNGPISGTLKLLSDGLGNDSALALSTGAASVTGTLAVTTGSVLATASGNVGVGFANPAELLTIQERANNAASNFIFLKQQGVDAGFKLGIDSSTTGGIFITSRASGVDTEKIFNILKNGNVGIGTSAPATQLHVAGTTISHIRSEATSTNGESTLSLLGKNASAEVRTFQIKYDNSDIVRVGTPNPIAIRFETNDVERLRILSDGGLTFNGDVSQANALDDYEEGTITATLTPNTSGTITLRGDAQTMRYTKIGRQVTIAGGIFVGSVSLPIGTELTLGGLPFTSGNGISFRSTAVVNFYDAPTYAPSALTSVMVDNTATLNIQKDASTLGANDEIYISFTYFV